jgi:hypothetical protein
VWHAKDHIHLMAAFASEACWVDGQWRQVDMVIETERADGVGVVWLYFAGHRPAVAVKTDLVCSGISQQIHE